MKKKYSYLMYALVTLFFLSCEYETFKPEKVEIPADKEISFSEEIRPVFVNKCSACHSAINPVFTEDKVYSSLVDGGYVDINNPLDSKVIKKIKSDHPAGNTFNATELALLQKWIEDGAKDN